MPKNPMKMNKTVCEFFAGIGLVHEALRRSGWRCIYANDIDPKKRSMYEGHYGPSPHYHQGDIWDVEAVLARIAQPPRLATASFPCTDMSLAGKRRGLEGAQSGSLMGFLQVLERLGPDRPGLVLLENVPGFLNSRHGQDFAMAAAQLAALGYWLDSFVLDARRFVPQSRQRLFLLGYQPELAQPPVIRRAETPDLLDDPWRRALDRSGSMRPATLRRAMESIELPTGWATVAVDPPVQRPLDLRRLIDVDAEQAWWDDAQTDRHLQMLSPRHRRQLDLVAEASAATTGLTVLTGFRRVRQGEQRLELRFDGVAGCLRTPRGGSAKQILAVVQRRRIRMRWMSPREYGRLQGAADYALPQNATQAMFGFGDAVCVPVIRWIDQQMLTPAFEADARRQQAGAQGPAENPHARSVLTR